MADQVLRPRDEKEFERENIGYLTKPVELVKWIADVRTRYGFLQDMDADEARWGDCNPRDGFDVTTQLSNIDADA